MRLPQVMARSAQEAAVAAASTADAVPGLARRGVVYLEDMEHFHRPATRTALERAGAIGFLDFPGIRLGDRLLIAEGTSIAGMRAVRGEATVTELSSTGVAFKIRGSVGPITQDVGVHMHQLTDDLVELQVVGSGAGRLPYLAHIDHAASGAVTLSTPGLPGTLSLQTARHGSFVLNLPIGGAPSTIVLRRA